MFCKNFLNAVKHGTVTLGRITDRDADTIYLDFVIRVNGTSAQINYCPFCSRIVRGRHDLAEVRQLIERDQFPLYHDEVGKITS